MAELSKEDISKIIRDELKKAGKPAAQPAIYSQDPLQAMKDAGFGAFTPQGQRALATIKERYNGDFKTFFLELNKNYLGYKKASAEVKRVSDVLSQIVSVSVLIDKLLASTDFKGSLDDVQDLRKRIDLLDKEFTFFTNAANLTDVLSEHIESTEMTTKIPLEKLKYAQGLFGKKVQQISKPPAFLPGAQRAIKTVGEAVLTSAATPFVPFLHAARAQDKANAARSETLENMAFNQAGVNIGTESAASTPFAPISAALGVGDLGQPRQPVGGESSTRRGGISLQDDLFAFFNSKAYQAKWTKELLASVVGGQMGGGGTDKGGQQDANLAGIAGMLTKYLAPAIGVLFAAQGGWMIGRWLGENIKFGGKSLDQHVQAGFTKMFGWDEKSQMKKAAKEIGDPVTRRAMELQAEDPKLNVRDAVAQAQMEWKGRPRLDIGGKVDLQTTNEERAKIGLPALGKDLKPITIPELRNASGSLSTQAISETVPALESDVSMGKMLSGMSSELPEMTDQVMGDLKKRVGEAGGTFSQALNTISEIMPEAKVPIDTAQAELQRVQKEGMDKLQTTVTEMVDVIKETGKGTTKKQPSGYDANNTRNPVLSSIGAGQITD